MAARLNPTYMGKVDNAIALLRSRVVAHCTQQILKAKLYDFASHGQTKGKRQRCEPGLIQGLRKDDTLANYFKSVQF